MWSDRGSGRLGVIIWIALMAAGVFAAVRIIPAKVAVYEFHDFVESQGRFSATRGGAWDEAGLRRRVLDKAREVGIPLSKKQVKIRRTKNAVRINIKHQVTVDLAVYDWVWEYDREFESLRM